MNLIHFADTDIKAKIEAKAADLRRAYAGSDAAVVLEEAVYAIPKEALAELRKSPLFIPSRVRAETDFTEVCASLQCIGIRTAKPVQFAPLSSQPLMPNPGFIEVLGWTKIDVLNCKAALKKLGESRERLLGAAGYFTTNPNFLSETEALRRRFEDLPAEERPAWPLRRPMPTPQEAKGERASGADTVDFIGRLTAHLDRWGLIALADWHLPDPQGPLLPEGLPAGAPASPRHGVHISLPLHYPLQGDDDLLRTVKAAQRQAAADLGLPAEAAGIALHEQYAQIFRLSTLERTLRSRLPTPPPSGAVGLIEKTAARVLGITANSIRRMRTLSNDLRSGKLSSIPRRRL